MIDGQNFRVGYSTELAYIASISCIGCFFVHTEAFSSSLESPSLMVVLLGLCKYFSSKFWIGVISLLKLISVLALIAFVAGFSLSFVPFGIILLPLMNSTFIALFAVKTETTVPIPFAISIEAGNTLSLVTGLAFSGHMCNYAIR